MIDLNKLYNRDINTIKINEKYIIDEKYIVDNRIKKLNPVTVSGELKLIKDDNLEDTIYAKLEIKGQMYIEDSVSLKEIEYEFNTEYDDYIDKNYINNENILDIFSFLWENIELEVPIKYTKEKNLNNFSGKDWQLISDEELTNNNPFKELLKDVEE